MEQTDIGEAKRRQPPLGEGWTKDDVSVLLQGQRIKLTATVDLEGIGRLKEMLTKYEDILKMLQ
jgi:hypothetical protein